MTPTFSWLYGPTPPPAERCCPGCSIPNAGENPFQATGVCYWCQQRKYRWTS